MIYLTSKSYWLCTLDLLTPELYHQVDTCAYTLRALESGVRDASVVMWAGHEEAVAVLGLAAMTRLIDRQPGYMSEDLKQRVHYHAKFVACLGSGDTKMPGWWHGAIGERYRAACIRRLSAIHFRYQEMFHA